MMHDSLTLRRANEEDVDFAFRVLRETMREYAIATWGSLLRLVEPFGRKRYAIHASLRSGRCVPVPAFAGVRLTHALARQRRVRGVTLTRLSGVRPLLHPCSKTRVTGKLSRRSVMRILSSRG
jgi:hypothetical protein